MVGHGNGVRLAEPGLSIAPGGWQGVLFDFHGTLAHASSWCTTHQEVLAHHGLAHLIEAWCNPWVGGAADGADHAEHSHSRATYIAWERQRLADRARRLGVSEEQLLDLSDDLHRAAKDHRLAAYDEVAETLEALRAAGLKLAVCSNWDWDLAQAVDAVGLTEYFDAVVTSAQVGARKPHPRIFQATLAATSLTAAQALYVGDSWGPDVAGPRAVGMAAAHLVRAGTAPAAILAEPRPDPHVVDPNTYVVANLVDVRALILPN
ncbi:MAG: HAD family hydrolase [Acidimicrobiales bacterium]